LGGRVQCGKEHHHEPPADRRVRLDPYDPSTVVPAPQCEHRGVTDPAVLRAILRVHDREGYWWVECSACDCGWQVPALRRREERRLITRQASDGMQPN
jgi:hypothetical protein